MQRRGAQGLVNGCGWCMTGCVCSAAQTGRASVRGGALRCCSLNSKLRDGVSVRSMNQHIQRYKARHDQPVQD